MNNFIDSMYLTMSFSVIINSSNLSMENTSNIINNIYACLVFILLVTWPLFISNKVWKGYNLREQKDAKPEQVQNVTAAQANTSILEPLQLEGGELDRSQQIEEEKNHNDSQLVVSSDSSKSEDDDKLEISSESQSASDNSKESSSESQSENDN